MQVVGVLNLTLIALKGRNNMQLKTYLSVALLSLALSKTAVLAHHDDGTDELQSETNWLVQAVNRSWLSYRIKSTVYAFSNDVNYLTQCTNMHPPSHNPVGPIHPIPSRHHEDGVSPYCYGQLQRVQQSFNYVSYYLSDAYDVPDVYRAYLSVRSAVYDIHQ